MFGSWACPGERWLNEGWAPCCARSTRASARASAASRRCSASEPAGVMAKEITTPGSGQIKALFVSAGNPVLSVPNGDELEDALRRPGPDGRPRPLRQRDDRALRLRAARHHDVRARRLPADVPDPPGHPVPAGHRGGRRAGRAGAHGVGDHRRPDDADVAAHTGVRRAGCRAKGVGAVRRSAARRGCSSTR